MEIKLNEVEVQKLNLQPDEVLVIKIKSDELNDMNMDTLRKGFRAHFPNNKVIVLGMGAEDSIDLTIAKGSEYPEANFCNDCSCGKKAAYEGTEVKAEGKAIDMEALNDLSRRMDLAEGKKK